MARSLEQRIADLEKTIMEFFTGRSKKTTARKTGKKAPARSAKKVSKARKTGKSAKRRSSK